MLKKERQTIHPLLFLYKQMPEVQCNQYYAEIISSREKADSPIRRYDHAIRANGSGLYILR